MKSRPLKQFFFHSTIQHSIIGNDFENRENKQRNRFNVTSENYLKRITYFTLIQYLHRKERDQLDQ